MRLKRNIMLGVILALFVLGSLDSQESRAQNREGKKYGFSGDPSKKRGLELGFDRGWQAAKNDQDQAEKLDPKTHDFMVLAEKLYRYEYGSRQSFLYGFERGFLKGYREALGGKIPAPPSTVARTGSKDEEQATSEKEKVNQPPALKNPPRETVRSDAL